MSQNLPFALCMIGALDKSYNRDVETAKITLAQGQVNGHNVLVQ